MSNSETARLRANWLPHASGDVLEVGIGSGLYFPFYSGQVQRVYGLDPSVELQRMARERALAGPLEVEFLLQSAEDPMPLADASICSHDVDPLPYRECSRGPAANQSCHQERWSPHLSRTWLRSRLKGGRLQDRLTPIWKRVVSGCHLNRRIDVLIEAAGFQITELKKGYLPGPRPMTYTYQGFAKRG